MQNFDGILGYVMIKGVDKPRILAWGTLTKKLKAQFLPFYTSWIARESFKRLKKIGYVHDYVNKFKLILLFDIKNMSDEDKLFNFISSLQT